MLLIMKSKIFNLLDDLGIKYEYLEHEPVFTVAESEQVIKDKTPVKNLVLMDEKTNELYMVICRGEIRLDLKNLANSIGTNRLVFAKPEVLKAKLGVTPGSVSIFSLLNNHHNDVTVLIDKEILTAKRLGFHPNDNTASIFIDGEDLEKILKNTKNSYKYIDIAS